MATALERKNLLQQASRHGSTRVRLETLRAAAFIFVLTTLPLHALAPASVLELYRGRWRIELVFKRLKSLLALGHLPKHDPQGARAWLIGKLLAAFLVEALLHAGESFFPRGYPLEPQGTRGQ